MRAVLLELGTVYVSTYVQYYIFAILLLQSLYVYKDVSENLAYTFALDGYKAGGCPSERIQWSTSVKGAVKNLC